MKIHQSKALVHQSPLKIARSYIKRGWSPIPIPHKTKEPLLRNWPKFRLTEKAAAEHFGDEPSNIGVVLGDSSGGLVDIDLDCVEANALAELFLPETLKFGRASSPNSHWLFTVSPAPEKTELFHDPTRKKKKVILEIRSNGSQTVFPESTHPWGELIEWSGEAGQEPTTISAETLRWKVASLAAATLLIRHWPTKGSRHNSMLALAGGLLTAGWTKSQAKHFIRIIASTTGDEDERDRSKCVTTTARKLDRGEPVLAWIELAKLVGDPVVRQVKEWLKADDAGDSSNATSRSRAKFLVGLIPQDKLFHSPSGIAYAEIEVGQRLEVHEVRSQELRRWLQQKCYAAIGEPARGSALEEAIAILEAIAVNDGEEREVMLRVAKRGDALYFDLSNSAGQIVRVTRKRYSILSSCSIRFRRTRKMLPLPLPEDGGSLDELREFINVEGEADWKLVIAWITFAFLPKGPFPVLTLNGEEGTAKSTTAKVLRELVDPNVAPLRARPRAVEDLMIAALHSWVVPFDNLSGVGKDISDGICCLAYNGAITGRTLYTNQEEHVIAACRPVILNGIDTIATRGDLASRSIALTLPRISGRQRLPEDFFWDRFKLRRPFILGAILAAISGALRHLPDISLKETPRMADFAHWGAAIEAALEWPEGTFEEAYRANRETLSDSVIESDVFATTVRNFMLTRRKAWEGTATDLLRALTDSLGVEKPDRSWPGNASTLGNRLRRSAPALRTMRIHVKFHPRQRAERRLTLRLV